MTAAASFVFEQLFDPESSTYTYLLGDRAAGICALVDPVREQIDRDLARVDELGLKLRYTIETHLHADHVTSGSQMTERRGTQPVFSSRSPATCHAVRLDDDAHFRVGDLELVVIPTPGHTPESVSLRLPQLGAVLTGDALLIGTCGRTDFQHGDAGTLWDSVHTRLFTLPDETRVFPAHDYKGKTSSTIGEEKRSNARLLRPRDAFIELMASLRLPPPRHIDEALPANLACGRPPVDPHAA
jgi:glyoxylase-like metal-dependent hydrolase (beta-lactamase superfamily II)